MIGHFKATSGQEINVPGYWNTLTVQVDGANPVTVSAKLQNASDFETVGAISLVDYSVQDSITEDGLYLISLLGVDSLKFTFSSGDVYYNVS